MPRRRTVAGPVVPRPALASPHARRGRPAGKAALRGSPARIAALMVLALAPTALAALLVGGELQRAAARGAGEDGERWIRLAAAPAARLVSGTQQLLVALARAPEVRAADRAGCRALFAGLIASDRRYADLGLASPDGAVLAAVTTADSVPLGDPLRRSHALTRGGFAFTAAQRPGVGSALIVAHPVSDGAGGLRYVLFAALRLDWLELVAADAALPRGALLLLTDRDGRIVSRHPADVAISEPVSVEALARQFGARDTHGQELRFTSAPVVSTPEYALQLTMGIPRKAPVVPLDRLATRFGIGLVLAALIALLWLWAGRDLLLAGGSRSGRARRRRRRLDTGSGHPGVFEQMALVLDESDDTDGPASADAGRHAITAPSAVERAPELGGVELRGRLANGSGTETQRPRAPQDPAGALPPPDRRRNRVLVVEDESMVRRVICESLRHKGYHVLEAGHPTAALALCRSPEVEFDLLITDVSMPGLTGPELVQRLPQRHAGVPVLFVSGRTDPELLERHPAAGPRSFLAKPFSPSQLIDQVQRLLGVPPALAA
jgi:CheY-like chemotaxis protein